jgi:hypothetical protein
LSPTGNELKAPLGISADAVDTGLGSIKGGAAARQPSSFGRLMGFQKPERLVERARERG